MRRLVLALGLLACACGGEVPDDAAPRQPIIAHGTRAFRYEEPQALGECGGDGSCKVNGCGNHCTAVTVPDFAATCEAAIDPDARCGCVTGVCVWYARAAGAPQLTP